MSDPVVRPMRPAEVAVAVDWAAAEGWNPGLADATRFVAADAGGFLCAEVGGEIAGTISAVAYGPGYGFLGLYIVRPDLRGRGVGMAMWRAAMDRMGDRLVGLDGVVERQADYARSGFALAYRHVRYEGPPADGAPPAGIVPLRGEHVPAALALDAEAFPGERAAFMESWLAPPHVAVGLVRGGRLAGLAVARRCLRGWKAGPVLAPDRAGAEALLDGLGPAVGAGPLVLDVPEQNPEAVALAEGRGMVPAFETARMYRAGARGVSIPPTDRVFGVGTLELG